MYFWEENEMSLIKGIHHVALRPTYAQFEKAKTFYLDLLGLKVVKSATLGAAADWEDEGEPGDPLEAATI